MWKDAGSQDERRAFFECVRRVVDSSELASEADYVQHGTTTTLLHSIAVACVADAVWRAVGDPSRLDELRRSALLHDYYLYDWHVPSPDNRMHGFTHPRKALDNAVRDFPDLSVRERDAIVRHMFPLVPIPPRYALSWVVSIVDKACSTYETIVRSRRAYPRLRGLCARYLPDVRLDVSASPTNKADELR